MEVWQAAEINTKPFLVFGLLIGLLGFVIIVWWGCSHFSLQKLRNIVDNYRELQEEGPRSETEPKKERSEVERQSGAEVDDYKPQVDEADIPDERLHDIE